jgi:uncharacterized protein YdeI (YjbR/CyaY-like superfamily)
MSNTTVPAELTQAFENYPALQVAFQSLSVEKQTEYVNFFMSAEDTPARSSRIEKNVDRILKGFGRTDCTCGLSKKMPQCDGSHKQLQTQ